MFDNQRSRVIQALDAAHAAYYSAEVFGGPSLYFHQRALDASAGKNLVEFADYVYALLAAWGMHRMGPGGSKMRDFQVFSASLQSLWPTILRLQDRSPNVLDESDWNDLKIVFTGLRCMASGTSLVGNSKVMAHALPKLIPPVDREYTLKFLFGHGQITNGVEVEWEKFTKILSGFFYPVLQAESFKSKAEQWMRQPDIFKWDTSPLKVVDNLIIGLSKENHADVEAVGKVPGR
jgi:hypothetical protein